MVLCRIAGVPIRLHRTFLLLVGAWLAFSVVRDGFPGLLTATFWLVAFFGSVLFHELGHAAVAWLHGIRTRAIVLLPIGGQAQLEMRRVSPRVDLLVSVAGPAASLLLAALSLSAWLIGGWPAALTLGLVNLLLGVFNLIPAFPMDGGRIFRALLVGRLGLLLANRIALGVGVAFAVSFAVLGLVIPEPGLVLLAAFMGLLQWREHRVQEILRQHPEWA